MAKADPIVPLELSRIEGHDPSARLAGWQDAAGLAALKPGFCFSPGDDRLFALGWPHLRFLVDEHRENREPAAAATRLLSAPALPHRWVWARETAERFVRAFGAPSVFELQPLAKELRPEAMEALWVEDRVTPADVASILSARIVTDAPGLPERTYPTVVYLLEAMVGSEVVATTLVDILETLPPNMLLGSTPGASQMTHALGFLLLRVRVPVATALKERLHVLMETVFAQNPHLRAGLYSLSACHARALHLVLAGAAAAERDTDRSPRWYLHAIDDPQLVRRRVAVNRLGWLPDARLVWIGGPTILRHYLRDVRQIMSMDDQRAFVRQVAPIKAPEMLPLMLELAAHSLVRGEAQEWLAAHREFSEPFLVERAKTGAVAEAALTALRKSVAAQSLASAG